MKILAVDLGTVRTGLAVSDPTELIASPVGTVIEGNTDVLIERVAAAAHEQEVIEIIVGHPRNMDGSCGASAKRCEEFAELLGIKTGLPVQLWDERMTTKSAISILNEANTRGKKRKAVVDTVAATVILQDYLDSKRIKKRSKDEEEKMY
jgi:putative Holliday junction resolvase